jgi:hypothetical protein
VTFLQGRKKLSPAESIHVQELHGYSHIKANGFAESFYFSAGKKIIASLGKGE